MFYRAESFNQSIDRWNTSKVVHMEDIITKLKDLSVGFSEMEQSELECSIREIYAIGTPTTTAANGWADTSSATCSWSSLSEHERRECGVCIPRVAVLVF